MLCFGFVAARRGAAPLVRFEPAEPFGTVSVRASSVLTDWMAAGAPRDSEPRRVDVNTTAGGVTASAFGGAYRSAPRNTGDPAQFVQAVYALNGADTLAAAAAAPVAEPDQRDPVTQDEVVLGGVEFVDDPDGYTTPNGHRYDPPVIGGVPAIPLLKHQRHLRRHTALNGEPGSGKTTMAEVAFGDELVQCPFDGSTTEDGVVGQWLPDPESPSGFAWFDGPLIVAMVEGRPFLADELGRAPHDVQGILLPVMDHRRSLVVKTNRAKGVITAKPGFCVIITNNFDSEYGLIDALNDRVGVTVTVPTSMITAMKLGVPQKFVNWAAGRQATAEAAEVTGGIPVWYPGLRTLIDARDNTAAFGLTFAASAIVTSCPDLEQRPEIATSLSHLVGDTVPTTGLTAAALPVRAA